MNDVLTMLDRWQLDVQAVRQRVYRAPTPRERERWHALWLLAPGDPPRLPRRWSGTHTRLVIGSKTPAWKVRPVCPLSRRGVPPRPQPGATSRVEGGGPGSAWSSGHRLANRNWKVVRTFIQRRFDRCLCRSRCLNYLHRLGFVLKRPEQRLLKADAEKRDGFVAAYAALRIEARAVGARILFVDEAHFRADVELRARWVLRGEPAWVQLDQSPAGRESYLQLGHLPGDA